jgi:hypothetical protein
MNVCVCILQETVGLIGEDTGTGPGNQPVKSPEFAAGSPSLDLTPSDLERGLMVSQVIWRAVELFIE